MFCPNCGKKITAEGKYCMECGASLPQQDSVEMNEALADDGVKDATEKPEQECTRDISSVPVNPSQNKKKNSIKHWIEVNPLRAVLALIAILFGILVITIIVTSVLGASRDRNVDTGVYEGNYGYYDDEYYGQGNQQWYEDNQWESDFEDTIDDVGATIPQGYTISYGKMLRHCFHNGSWSYNNSGSYDDNDVNISYLGACLYQGNIADAEVFFIENEQDTYVISTVVVNGKTLTAEEISAFVAEQYQKYQEDKSAEASQS